MAKLERRQIQTLNAELNNIYDRYKGIVQCMSRVARSGLNPSAYTIELSEEQKEEMGALCQINYRR